MLNISKQDALDIEQMMHLHLIQCEKNSFYENQHGNSDMATYWNDRIKRLSDVYHSLIKEREIAFSYDKENIQLNIT